MLLHVVGEERGNRIQIRKNAGGFRRHKEQEQNPD